MTLSEAYSLPQGETLASAYAKACAYWDSLGTASKMMALRANVGVQILGGSRKLSTLTPADGTAILVGLSQRGLSRVTAASYYAAIKRMVALSGGSTLNWPKAPKAPRKVRNVEAQGVDFPKLLSLQSDLTARGYESTAFLVQLLMGTGMRVDVEALDWKAWEVLPERQAMRITGKGGHQREIPVARDLLKALQDRQALVTSMKRVPYNTHYKRLKLVTDEVGFHDVRRWYATKAYRNSGKDLRVVQELLGHADVSTTANYVGVSMEDLRKGACDGN